MDYKYILEVVITRTLPSNNTATMLQKDSQFDFFLEYCVVSKLYLSARSLFENNEKPLNKFFFFYEPTNG